MEGEIHGRPSGLVRGGIVTQTFEIPIHLPSLANLREHWAVRAKRAKEHRAAARTVVRVAPLKPGQGAVVTLTRRAPRALDDDNIRGAFKSIRDGVADALGIDDRDPRVEWRYIQQQAKPSGVIIEVRTA